MRSPSARRFCAARARSSAALAAYRDKIVRRPPSHQAHQVALGATVGEPVVSMGVAEGVGVQALETGGVAAGADSSSEARRG